MLSSTGRVRGDNEAAAPLAEARRKSSELLKSFNLIDKSCMYGQKNLANLSSIRQQYAANSTSIYLFRDLSKTCLPTLQT